MGLSISYQIVTQRHGGSLKFISQAGQGAEFIVTIPLSKNVKVPYYQNSNIGAKLEMPSGQTHLNIDKMVDNM